MSVASDRPPMGMGSSNRAHYATVGLTVASIHRRVATVVGCSFKRLVGTIECHCRSAYTFPMRAITLTVAATTVCGVVLVAAPATMTRPMVTVQRLPESGIQPQTAVDQDGT